MLRPDKQNMSLYETQIVLQVLISDNGAPSLSSTTRVVIKVEDINDNSPEFVEQAFYTVTIPATGNYDRAMFQVSKTVFC